jgi:hypothetical protein
MEATGAAACSALSALLRHPQLPLQLNRRCTETGLQLASIDLDAEA